MTNARALIAADSVFSGRSVDFAPARAGFLPAAVKLFRSAAALLPFRDTGAGRKDDSDRDADDFMKHLEERFI